MRNSSIITVITASMAILGLLGVYLVREVGSSLLVAAALIATLSFAVKRRPERLKSIWNLAAILLFLFFALDYMLFSQNLMGSAIRFLTILAATKLFDLKSARDYLVFYSLVFFQIIAAAASSTSPLFLLIISIFIICSIWAMIIFNIKGELESRYTDTRTLPPNLFSPSFLLTTVALTAFSIIITFALFFIIPRVGIGLMQNRDLTALKVSGFSDSIRLGDLGAVKRDTAVVMRVELPAGLPENEALYFRGQTLDRYSSTGWEATTRKKRKISKKSTDRFVLGRLTEIGSSMIEQNITLEPLETDVIFGASRLMVIDGGFQELWTNESGGVYLPNIPYSRVKYTAISSVDAKVKEAKDSGIDYLETSELSADVMKLAKRITRERFLSEQEKAEKIKRYLRENYSYTLSPDKGAGATPLDDFLFFTKEGYCEQFATAYAALLRGAGIRARIVTGFLQGEWNKYGGYLLIRQQDAHSWVEANIDGYWRRLDATPSIGLVGFTRTSTLSMYLDSLGFKWRRYIVKYSLSDQLSVARSVESQTNRLSASVRNFIASIKDMLSGKKSFSQSSLFRKSSPALALLILITIIWALFIKYGRGREDSEEKKERPRFYRTMEKTLKKIGLERRSSETATEFARRSGISNVRDITEAFESVRYGHRELTKIEMRKIEESLKALKSSAGQSA